MVHELNSVRNGSWKMLSTKESNSMDLEKIISLRMKRQHMPLRFMGEVLC
ncbi:hypothetical protein [Anaerocolumna sp. MB42-C2]|nr:hypothetical protein [Anaerocolumna sp. MB42-C2]WMJ90800.1 hypothetical protein RBU59_12350 [Anaerocolumna sp. MB42-C2]